MRLAVDANTLLSGLFFRGNERRLLLASVRGPLTLVIAEDVLDEVWQVVTRVFDRHDDLLPAIELLEAVLGGSEVIRRNLYAKKVSHWADRLRDPFDAPLLACAQSASADAVVSGDKDVIEMRGVEGLAIYRTREVLARLQVTDRER